MPNFDLYNINLKNISSEHPSFEFEYTLNEDYFKLLENSEIKKGLVHVHLKVEKQGVLFYFVFDLEGYVEVTCNRCLDPMQQSIEYNDTLKVKLGESYNDEEEIIIVPDNNPMLNIAWFLYEFITLSLPLTHTHEKEKCNKEIIDKLNNHIVDYQQDENEKKEIDPRWEKLKDIIKND